MEAQGRREAFEHIGPTISLAPFAEILQPLIDEDLAEQEPGQFRQGTGLMSKVLMLAGAASYIPFQVQTSNSFTGIAFKCPLPENACSPSRSTSLRQLYRQPRLSPNSRSTWLSVLPLVRANSIVSNLNSLLYFCCFLLIIPSVFSIFDFLYVY